MALLGDIACLFIVDSPVSKIRTVNAICTVTDLDLDRYTIMSRAATRVTLILAAEEDDEFEVFAIQGA